MTLGIKSFKALFQSGVFKNAFALGLLQIINYVFPLLTIPFVIRVLGVNGFGVVTFSQLIAGYLAVVTDYGFNMSGTRSIAINKENHSEVNRLFNTIIACKLLIAVCGIIILTASFFVIRSIEPYRGIYVISLLFVVGQAFFPVWFFQGMEDMKKIVLFSALFKFLFTVAVFLFVKAASDIDLVVWFYSLGSIIAGLAAFVYAIVKYKLRVVRVTTQQILDALKDGFEVFIPTFFSSILINGGVFLLGLLHSISLVGVYGGIDKLIKAGMSVLGSLTQALFPNVSSKFLLSKELAISSIKRIGSYFLIALIPIFVSIALFSKMILAILYNDVLYQQYAYVLGFLLLWAFIAFLNNFIGVQFLVGSGESRIYKKAFLCSAVVTIASFTSIKFFAIDGVLFSLLAGESSLTAFMFYFIKKNKLYEA